MGSMMDRPEWSRSRPADGSRPIIDSDVFPSLDAPFAPSEKQKSVRRKEIRKPPALY
jgi:hypothetical protein